MLVVKNGDGYVAWFENSGQPARDNRWKRHLVSTDIKRACDVAIVDFNGDGWIDIAASAYSSNYLAWLMNPGPTDQREWKKEIIDSQLMEARTVRIADFNRDGLPDILGTGLVGNLTGWYERTKDASAPWKRHVVDDLFGKPVHGEPVDLDHDGDQDIVMACGMSAAADAAKPHYVVWYKNRSQPRSTVSWKRHEVIRLPYAFEVVAADLDNDGDRDLVATAWGGMSQIVCLENTGSPLGPWRQHDLKTSGRMPISRSWSILIATVGSISWRLRNMRPMGCVGGGTLVRSLFQPKRSIRKGVKNAIHLYQIVVVRGGCRRAGDHVAEER